MSLFAIADLHLSAAIDKPMDIFGDHWAGHVQKIAADWHDKVCQADSVLIPGDISWAMTMEEVRPNLDWLHGLPGYKILLRGNHDYWWGSISKLNALYEDMFFIQNNYTLYQDYAICGTRGWLCPEAKQFTEHDNKIYLRECERLKLSLDAAHKAGYKKVIVAMHYPPVNEGEKTSGFTQILEQYKVEKVLYGHLHNQKAFQNALTGYHQGTYYDLVSSDYLQFNLKKII